MMLYQEARGFDPAAVRADLHPDGFARIHLGADRLLIDTPEEADALIRAAIAAKDLLLAVPAGECTLCGHANGVHREGCPAGPIIEARTPMLTPKGEAAADEESPCMMAGCGHDYDDHSLDLERGDRLYCQRCECRRYLSAVALTAATEDASVTRVSAPVYDPLTDNCAGSPGCGDRRVIFTWFGPQACCPRCYVNVFGGEPDPASIVTIPAQAAKS